MREIRGSQPEATAAVDGPTCPQTLTAANCEALFNHWRLVIMGNLDSAKGLPAPVAGYFFEPGQTDTNRSVPIPLGAVRRRLMAALGRTELTDEERTVVDLYYGMNGLPLPYSSQAKPDIAGGRHESSPRGTARAAMAKVARQLTPRVLEGYEPATPIRPLVDPTLEPWFLTRAIDRPARVRLIAKAYTRAVAQCDGPYAPATLVALHHWYRNCGHLDPDLLHPSDGLRRRPNRHGLARAAALMEVALFEELNGGRPSAVSLAAPAPVPSSSVRVTACLPETVTSPELAMLVDDDLSPAALIAAALVLKERSLDGDDIVGQTALFLRCVRPRLHRFQRAELEHLATAVSYLAITPGNPFLALEWLGHVLGRVGITDRTFTILVNASEAASIGGYHAMAGRIHGLFNTLRRQWELPRGQIPMVEHWEAEQQRLMADGFRHERLAALHHRNGCVTRAERSLVDGFRLATESTRVAYRMLTDGDTFPVREMAGKAGRHGGDLEWSWALASARRIVASARELTMVADRTERGRADRGRPEIIELITPGVDLARRVLSDYDDPITNPRFRRWFAEVEGGTALLTTLG